MATYLEQSLAKLKEFEGCVPWMYRDTVGKVTVGVGLMLPDAKAAEALPFVIGTRAATPEEIAAEYARVDAMAMGRASAFYKTPTSLELTQQTIDAKLSSVLAGIRGRPQNPVPPLRHPARRRKDGAARHDLQPRPRRAVQRISPPRGSRPNRSMGRRQPSTARAADPAQHAMTGPDSSSSAPSSAQSKQKPRVG